jgi:PHP family Zn ribbon phosphoesterase
MSLAWRNPVKRNDRSPLTRCKCQRLNTLEDYRRNDGKCPKCGELMKLEDE